MNEIVTRPQGQTPDVFDKMLRGFYGEFKSDSSFPVSFIQTAVRINEIDVLKTATEAFSTRSLDFEELIQRDIDQSRVKSIVDSYLKKGQDRVLFFPPLLASLVAVDGDEQISDYSGVAHDLKEADGEVRSTWGGDRFQIIMPISADATGYQYNTQDAGYESLPYWSILRVNTDKMRLVVIDGQHRLSALKYLANSQDPANKRVVENMSVPICVLFPPDAVKGNQKHETVNRDLRELFVRINSTAKQVSGHFLTLLDDKSLSSFAIREFCELCKDEEIHEGLTALNLIEWNQRETRFASQINRPYSITTIQIISDVLKEYAFGEKEGYPATILNLEPFKIDLEKDGATPINDISESHFSVSQIDSLQEIIRKGVAPAMRTLFFQSMPYMHALEAFKRAASDLDREIAEDIAGAAYFKQKVLQQYRDVNKFDGEEPELIRMRFEDRYTDYEHPEEQVFRLNVFQQGLVRVWIDLSVLLSKFGVSPIAVADMIVKACEPVCFNTSTRLFDNERIYLGKLIFNGARVVVNKRAKSNWKRLILASFMNDDSKNIIRESLSSLLGDDVEEANAEIEGLLDAALSRYLDDLETAYRKDYENHWADKDFSAQVMMELESLSQKAKGGDEEAEEQMRDKLYHFAKQRHDEAAQKLKAALKVS